MLVDAASYFARLDEALRQARRSILIIGWDFDGRIRLRPDGGPEALPLSGLLHGLVEAHPDLEIRILVWSVATLHAPSETLPLVLGARWQEHPRIHLRLDREHPIYAAHHQKIVCIDGSLAFAGGIDLTIHRWDRSGHSANDPVRLTPEGSSYGPVHDLQMVVDGAAARAVTDLAHARWQKATGEALDPISSRAALWPADLEPDFVEVPVAIARTAPHWGKAPAIREVAALVADALEAARHSIYIETQYLASTAIGDLLARRLASEDGPEIVIVTTRALPGLLERFAMGSNRDRLIRRMKRADRFGRLRIYHPVVPAADGERAVLVHAKLLIVDEALLRVGSSNLNNRSFGLDTECDLAIEARDEAERRSIARLRERLLAEHLGVRPERVAEALTAERSLVRAIDALNHNERGLRAFDAIATAGPTRPLFGTGLLDPKKPFEPLWFLRRKRSKTDQAG